MKRAFDFPSRFMAIGFLSVVLAACSITPVMDEAGTAGRNSVDAVEPRSHTNSTTESIARSEIKRRLGNINATSRHLSESHTSNLILRPASSAQSLVSGAINITSDFLKDTTLDLIRFPLLKRKPIPELSDQPAMDLALWEHDLDRLTGRPVTYGNVEMLIGGDEFFPRFEQAILQAEKSIMIRTYIFDNDDYAVKIADLLKQRSSEVSVRILYDGVGTLVGGMVDSSSLPAHHKSPSSIKSYLESNSAIQVRKMNNAWLVGDHTKTILIDGQTGFMGGMNIGREYRYDWHDVMFQVTGEVVKQLNIDAEKAWQQSGKMGDLSLFKRAKAQEENKSNQKGQSLRLLYTRPFKSEIYLAQLRAVRRAKDYIYLQNAYFSDDQMLYELARARRRGVDVRVVLPSRGDSGPMDKSNRLAANSMLRHGIRVFVYPGMSHVKAAIYDGWACFGSANFDKMSLRLNRELNIGTSDPGIVNALKDKLFTVDFERSIELMSPMPVNWSDHLYERLADIAL